MKLARGSRPLSEINVTPLVDVFLVLLVIFMITAPVLKSALEVGLPRSVSGLRTVAAGITVELRRDGGIFVEGRAVAAAELGSAVRALLGGESAEHSAPGEASGDTGKPDAHGPPVFLAADEGVPYGEVVLLLDRLRGEGVSDVALLTEPPRVQPRAQPRERPRSRP